MAKSLQKAGSILVSGCRQVVKGRRVESGDPVPELESARDLPMLLHVGDVRWAHPDMIYVSLQPMRLGSGAAVEVYSDVTDEVGTWPHVHRMIAARMIAYMPRDLWERWRAAQIEADRRQAV